MSKKNNSTQFLKILKNQLNSMSITAQQVYNCRKQQTPECEKLLNDALAQENTKVYKFEESAPKTTTTATVNTPKPVFKTTIRTGGDTGSLILPIIFLVFGAIILIDCCYGKAN